MLAQLVEQRTFNPLVGSSNLPHPTNYKPYGTRKACYLKHSRLFCFGIFLFSLPQGCRLWFGRMVRPLASGKRKPAEAG